MRQKVNIDDTRFIFSTNFSGDPERDRFGSKTRRANVVIPTKEQAQALLLMGVNVKMTKPNPERQYDDPFEPEYYVPIIVNMESKWPPHVFWITPEGRKLQCTIDTIGQLDYIRTKNVCVQANLVENKRNPGAFSLYADVMYVEQDVDADPYAQRYATHNTQSDPVDVPFI